MEDSRKIFIQMVIARIVLLILIFPFFPFILAGVQSMTEEPESLGFILFVAITILLMGLPHILIFLSSLFMKEFLRKTTIIVLFLSMAFGVFAMFSGDDLSSAFASFLVQMTQHILAIFILTRRCYKYYC